jgi:hypothetical protein
MPRQLIDAYLDPPSSPGDCIFARTTECISADLRTQITPCQFGGTPDCSSCGCMASAGLAAVGRHRLGGIIPIDVLFNGSIRAGQALGGLRRDAALAFTGSRPPLAHGPRVDPSPPADH